MPSTEHVEAHFTATAAVRDIVIGMSDGLTVPFALAAGLTGAVASTAIVVTAGFAEIAAGSIAMGLGGYLAAKTDSEHYASERQREIRETVELADVETEEVAKVFRDYGLSEAQMEPIVARDHLRSKSLGRFHDAFRAGLGGTRSRPRGPQRRNDRCFLYRRGSGSACALYPDEAGPLGALGFRRGHAARAFHIWIHQRPLTPA